MDGHIDLSYEALDGPRSTQGVKKERAWLASDLKADDWLVPVNEDAKSEINTMIQKMRSHPLPMLLRRPDQFDIPHLREIYMKCESILNNGIGFAVIDKLPIDDYDFDNIIEVYWTLGQLIGPNVAQNGTEL